LCILLLYVIKYIILHATGYTKDEITKLEQVVNYLENLKNQLENWEMSEREILTEIDFNDDVKKHFLIETVEIIRDELRFSRLADFVDSYGEFVIRHDLLDLLGKVIRGIEFRLEQLKRGLRWQS